MSLRNLFRRRIVAIFVILTFLTMNAQVKKLPAPSFTGGMPMNEVIASRHSVRDFDTSRPVEDNTLGQLLWMALGVNRPDSTDVKFERKANRSNPTALNYQEIHAYVFDKDGVWQYLPDSHSLTMVKSGDHRPLIAGTAEFKQDFAPTAPLTVVFVADLTNLPDDSRVQYMAMMDAGIACENLNLACASLGLATVPRATMDTAGISSLLGFTARQIPLLNNPVGYPAAR